MSAAYRPASRRVLTFLVTLACGLSTTVPAHADAPAMWYYEPSGDCLPPPLRDTQYSTPVAIVGTAAAVALFSYPFMTVVHCVVRAEGVVVAEFKAMSFGPAAVTSGTALIPPGDLEICWYGEVTWNTGVARASRCELVPDSPPSPRRASDVGAVATRWP